MARYTDPEEVLRLIHQMDCESGEESEHHRRDDHQDEQIDNPDDIDFECEAIEDDGHSSDSEQELEDALEDDDDLDDEMEDFTFFIGKNNDTLWANKPISQTAKTRSKNIIKTLPGPKGQARSCKTKLECFLQIITSEMIDSIVNHTNTFIAQRKDGKNETSDTAVRERDYKPTTKTEIRAVFGALYLIAVKRGNRADFSEFFTKNGTGLMILRANFSERRFRLLLRSLRFDDVMTREQRSVIDKLAPIRNFHSTFVQNCQKAYNLGEYVTIDEMLVAFRGRCSFVQYMPKKPAKYGIKIYALCDAQTCYTYNMIIYCGTQKPEPYVTSNKPFDIVKNLTQPLQKTNRNVTTDNWFSSYPLAEYLLSVGLTFLGTLRKNKSEIPSIFVTENKNLLPGSHLFGCNDIAALVSFVTKKKKVVLVLSTMHDGNEVDVQTGKPVQITDYNATKGGVDTIDLMCSRISTSRRTRRWPMTIFFRYLDIAGINSMRIYQMNKPLEKNLRREYLSSLAMELMYDNLRERAKIRSLPKDLNIFLMPPDRPVIYDGKRRDRTKLLEPYNEGTDVNLVCEVSAGRPRPRVTWFLDNVMIDDSYEQRADGLTVNHLSFPKVGRQHLNARLICQATNTNLVPPATKVVLLDLNMKPVSVEILTKERHISADKRYEVECQATGSRPVAVITWWKGSRQIKKIAKNLSEEGNQSMSILNFIPVIDDDGKYLTCRAENPWIPDSALEDKWKLNVHYMPVVTLKMGSSLNPDDIKEGDDVYFECNIRANPKAYRLAWFHNGEEMKHNVSGGVILSDHSLVLQGVTRATAGEFTCLAANTEGKGTSNPVHLRVMYVPTCKEEKEELYGALKQETVELKCQVDANPPLVTFKWTFNNSGDQAEVPPTRYTATGTISTLNYTPESEMDYGTLSCWGTNIVGIQKTPCVYQVVAAGRPFPLVNCSISNQTAESLQVDCVEGFDGGLPQWFVMELLQLPGLQPRRNVTSHRPTFTMSGIVSGASYQVLLYSVNGKGRSEPLVLETVSFKGVAKYTVAGPLGKLPVRPVVLVLVASAAALIATTCGVGLALRRRGTASGNRRPAKQADQPARQPPSPQARSPLDETDPDLIPNKYDFVERRPLKSLMKMYKTPCEKRKKRDERDCDDEEEKLRSEDDLHQEELHRYNHNNVQGGQVRNPSPAISDTLIVKSHNQKLGPEVVTANHRIQESCI